MRRRGVGAIANYKAALRDIKRRRAKGLPVNPDYAAHVHAAASTRPEPPARPWWADKEEDDTVRTEPGDFTTTYEGQPFRVDAWDPSRQHLVRVWTRSPEREALARVTHHGWTNGKYAQVRNRKTGE